VTFKATDCEIDAFALRVIWCLSHDSSLEEEKQSYSKMYQTSVAGSNNKNKNKLCF
jgi:hypothetical protein